MKKFFLLLLLSGSVAMASAQCPTFFKCPPTGVVTVEDITNNDAELWSSPLLWDIKNQTNNLPETEARVSMLAKDVCVKNTLIIRYILTLDLNNDGTPETVVDSENLPAEAGVVYNSNPNGASIPFDNRSVAANQKYRFAIEQSENDFATYAQLKWNTDADPDTYYYPQLPNGKHHIVWTIEADGVQNACAYDIVVTDKEAPAVSCFNNLSLTIMPTGMVLLWASDLVQIVSDNITPTSELNFGIRRSGTGTGFPLDPQGNPITNVFFTCDDLGTQPIELWVMDGEGNTGLCQTSVEVQDLLNICSPAPPGGVTVCAQHYCDGEGISEVGFVLYGASPALPPINLLGASTDDSGCEYLNLNGLPISDNYFVSLIKDTDPLNGVNSFDVMLLEKHLTGEQPLADPWQYVAADINKSNSLTTFDVIELNKLILGVYTEFPNNTSWRFFNADCMPSLDSPGVFFNCSSLALLADVEANQPYVFNGVKIGDLNCSAITAVAAPRGSLALDVPDMRLRAGQTVEVPLFFNTDMEIAAFQLELQTLAGLRILRIDGLRPDATHQAADGRWLISQPGFTREFTLVLAADTDLRLSEALQTSRVRLQPEAYTPDGDMLEPALRFVPEAAQVGALQVRAPQPNPTGYDATLGIRLEQAQTFTVELFDIAGKQCWSMQQNGETGFQTVRIPAEAMSHAGIFLWRVSNGETSLSGKLVRR